MPETMTGGQAITAALEALGVDCVFGVPSLVAGGHVFWGEDATDMFLDYLADPGLFDTEAIHRLDALPVGAIRKQWQQPTDRVGTNTPPL